jgi:hypothetical protein
MEHRLRSDECLGLFGRYFLALLMGVVKTRTGGGLPCYFYVDEAWQYIKDEPIVRDLIATARRQKIALTFAQQHTGQITNTQVLKALQTCGIKIEAGKRKHYWNVQVHGGELVEIAPPLVDFSKMNGMPLPEWNAILDDMHRQFTVDPPEVKPPAAPRDDAT